MHVGLDMEDNMKDRQGRPYVRLDTLIDGQPIELDDGFTCHDAGVTHVRMENGRPFFICDEGQHFLVGQCDDGIHCIGVYAVQ